MLIVHKAKLILSKIFPNFFVTDPKNGKTYVGFTSNLIERFKSHNSLSRKGFTKNF
ncbi:MAG: GIY-YIG nuclease family protein [Cloacibacterium normanense]